MTKRISGILGLAVLLVTLLSAQPDISRRNYYTGTLSKNIAIQMDLSFRKGSNNVSGTYFYETVGIRLELNGSSGDDGSLVLEEYDENDQQSGTFRGKLSAGGETLEGNWHSADGRKSFPFLLQRVAEYQFLNHEQKGVKGYATYPRFIPNSGAFGMLNALLADSAAAVQRRFVQLGKERYPIDSTAARSDYEQRYDAAIVYYSRELLSIRVEGWEYTGGAHGNSFFIPGNYWLKDNTVDRIKLADLFLPESNCMTVLSQQCLERLREKQAQWVISGMVKELKQDNLRVFSLTPAGITFSFGPYEVGPYSQGSMSVTVPYQSLTACVDHNGPLRHFVKNP